MSPHVSPRLALTCLLAGAVGIAFAPLFVRWSEVGPSATAFYRVLLALPLLGLGLAGAAARPPTPGAPPASPSDARARWRVWGWLLLPGVFFAADLGLWHWSIRLTSVANATLLTNVAPVFVTLAARVLFLERITGRFLTGLALALGGATLVVGSSLSLSRDHVLGDLFGLATAVFYAGYMLAVKHVRRTQTTLAVMVGSCAASAPLLWAAAVLSGETLLPASAAGWTVLVGLALVSQVIGQGLIAFAFRHLPAAFSALSLLLQPVVAAVLAALLLGEDLSLLQAGGGLVVLVGIAVASQRPRG